MRFFALQVLPWAIAGLVLLAIIVYSLYKMLPTILSNSQDNKERKIRAKNRQEDIERSESELSKFRDNMRPIISWLIINREKIQDLPSNVEEKILEANNQL